jgi:hypothetical protein
VNRRHVMSGTCDKGAMQQGRPQHNTARAKVMCDKGGHMAKGGCDRGNAWQGEA